MNKPLATLITLSALAACGGGGAEQDVQAAAPDSAPAAASQAQAPAPAAGGVTDPQIAHIVVTANQVDITAGELAASRSTNPQVKEFAQRMVTDHTAVNQSATELAGRLGVTPEDNPTSQQLQQGGEQNRAALQGKSGAEFDRAYIDQEVAYHQAVLDAIDGTLIPGAQNAELKALLQQTRPAVAAHLEHARQLQGSLGGQ
jgi:putative membrane protein